ncbi:MAG TPA: DAK2 domain-containing protein [Bacillota bacterium]|nr:DAK2 domain-containing protein [Bacillota bacterium]HOG52429.1 DAK2 domain-containing protein [Bacillota bacterium]
MAVASKLPASKSLDGKSLNKAFRDAVQYVGERKASVDALNVFPVPDGDTGTNMYLTMNSAVKEMDKYPAEKIGEVANSIALGCLMGARGNSGVIFSQLMRGFAKRLQGKKTATSTDVAEAIMDASNMAYKAVIKPVEGTILTVSRVAGREALEANKAGSDIIDIFKAALEGAKSTLEKTPELLPVLKEAGVVDAGGKGYVLFLEGLIESLEGKTGTNKPVEIAHEQHIHEQEPKKDLAHIEFRYCTEFIIKGSELDEEKIRKDIEMLGDSMLVVGIPETMKVHIHSNNPGKVLEKVVKYGTLHEIHINNMADQHEDFVMPDFSKGSGPASNAQGGKVTSAPAVDVKAQPSASARAGEKKAVATIAVSAGDGLSEIFYSLGVDKCVTGGQTLNPSIQEISEAVEATGAKEVIILPNNKNVILTAKQAADVVKAKVHVIPSKTMQQGIAAMMGYNSEMSAKDNVDRMNKGITSVSSGEITYAVRDTKINGLEIKQNDYIGIIDGQLLVKGSDLNEVVMESLDKMIKPESEIITIFYGSEVEEGKASEMVDNIQQKYADMSIELHSGGQPVYYYLISVE